MSKLIKIALIIVLMLSFTSPLMGQVNVKKLGQATMKFLSVPVGARGAAMGDAFTAVSSGAEAMFWNPAGMAKINRWDISGGYNKWIAEISHQHVDFAYNVENIGVFGVNAIWVDYGTLYGTRRSEVASKGYINTGEFSPIAYAAGLAYSRQVSHKFSFGVNLKYVRQNLGDAYVGTGLTTEEFETKKNEHGVFAFDFGILYYTGIKDLRLGVSAQHLSQEVKYVKDAYSLPFILKIGLAMDLLKVFGVENSQSLTLAIDASHPRDYVERVHFGLEYWLYDMFALRAGYRLNYDEDIFSFGIGLKEEITGLRIDYAYSPFGNFDAVHRISIGHSL